MNPRKRTIRMLLIALIILVPGCILLKRTPTAKKESRFITQAVDKVMLCNLSGNILRF